MEIRPEILGWLLDSDPAIRWQVMKDILHEQPVTYEGERSLLTKSGWCAHLLSLQDEDGLWNHSLYNGKWISTTYSLYLLKILGLSPQNHQALTGCGQLVTHGLYQNREIRFSRAQEVSDFGVTALVLSLCSYFGYEAEAIPRIASFLKSQQTREGNWLPNASPSAQAYTFETTLLVLEAFLQYQNHYPGEKGQLNKAVQKGQEFLLRNTLGLGTEMPGKGKWVSFSFPPYWFYDILTALDYFCCCRANKDSRLHGVIEFLRHKESRDGTWLLGTPHQGKTYFDMEKPGAPSRWNTLRALRVLDWWNGG